MWLPSCHGLQTSGSQPGPRSFHLSGHMAEPALSTSVMHMQPRHQTLSTRTAP